MILADDGVASYPLNDWLDFHALVAEFDRWDQWVFRGHSDCRWNLVPTLLRLMGRSGQANVQATREAHLECFQRGAIGRRTTKASQEKEMEWALGQHYGLATPYLDWTFSPYVAAYFALEAPSSGQPNRVVWALNKIRVEEKSDDIMDCFNGDHDHKRPPIIEFIRPLAEDNARLMSQNGLFTEAPITRPNHPDVHNWVKTHFRCSKDAVLVGILLPRDDTFRKGALKNLNRMNVSALTLFPDLEGAARYANLALEIAGYDPEV